MIKGDKIGGGGAVNGSILCVYIVKIGCPANIGAEAGWNEYHPATQNPIVERLPFQQTNFETPYYH
jgi:hypothetical protein